MTHIKEAWATAGLMHSLGARVAVTHVHSNPPVSAALSPGPSWRAALLTVPGTNVPPTHTHSEAGLSSLRTCH